MISDEEYQQILAQRPRRRNSMWSMTHLKFMETYPFSNSSPFDGDQPFIGKKNPFRL
jgi:hypothetical protein